MAVSMIDLTTLEGADTPGKVRSLCAQAMRPDPDRPDVPPVAAICIYPDLVGRRSSGCAAPASTSRPSPRRSRRAGAARGQAGRRGGRRRRGRRRDRHGDRPRRLPLRPLRAGVRGDRRRQGGVRRGPTSRSSWRPASSRATTTSAAPPGSRILAGADVIKTSTGKVSPAATLPVALVMLLAVRDWHARHRPYRRRQAGRRHPHGQGRDPPPRRRQRDGRAGLAHPRPLPLRRLHPAQRPAAAAPSPNRGHYSSPDYMTVD